MAYLRRTERSLTFLLPSYVLDNYLAVHKAFSFSKETWRGLAIDSINGSWCDETRKKEILALLDGVMTEWADKEI